MLPMSQAEQRSQRGGCGDQVSPVAAQGICVTWGQSNLPSQGNLAGPWIVCGLLGKTLLGYLRLGKVFSRFHLAFPSSP